MDIHPDAPGPRAGYRNGQRATRWPEVSLGGLWLADGALQLQPFMFTRAFATQVIAPNATGQPWVVGWPVRLVTHLIEPRIMLFNACAASIQLLIGIGLLWRPSVRVALALSFGWALGVWWIGEGLGGILTGSASPLTGAPGAALLYLLTGLIIWPAAGESGAGAEGGGALGERGTCIAWALLWLGLLGPLPEEPFETGLLLTPRVDRFSQVTVRCCRYSVPVRPVGRQVRVVLRSSELIIYDRHTEVARHAHLTVKGPSYSPAAALRAT